MPAPYVKKLAKQKGMSVSDAEKKWNSAKGQAKKEGHGEDYAYITSIFKRMMHAAALADAEATKGKPLSIPRLSTKS